MAIDFEHFKANVFANVALWKESLDESNLERVPRRVVSFLQDEGEDALQAVWEILAGWQLSKDRIEYNLGDGVRATLEEHWVGTNLHGCADE